MKKQTEEFINQLDELNKKEWTEIYEALKSVTDVFSICFNIYPSQDILSKFGLTKDINFSVINNNGYGKMKYYYKGRKVEPECYYLRPNNYSEVSLLEVLHECIAQNTNTPDIKHLEVQSN